MPSGGARKGAGRKPGLQAEAYRKALIDLIEENKQGLAMALVTRGLQGDVPALKEINDRALGKVPQPLSGDKDNPLFPIPILSKMNVRTHNSNPKGQPAQ